MSPNQWGPPIWSFFHTLAEKINEEKFNDIFPQLFAHITRICSVLPCPECSSHATAFLSKVQSQNVKTKWGFKHILHVFHNSVNQRKNKPMQGEDILQIYSNKNIIDEYNRFVSVYQTKGNIRLLADTFQRTIIIKEFREWFIKNINYFR
jgi:hypothetical protein